jgi:hypothetical protein
MPVAEDRRSRLADLVRNDADLRNVWRALFELREGTTLELAARAGVSPETAHGKLRELENLGITKVIPGREIRLLPPDSPNGHYYISADGYADVGVLNGVGN